MADYVVGVRCDKLEAIPHNFSELGRLDVIPLDERRDYCERYTLLDMGKYDQEALVQMGSVLRAWLKSLRFPIGSPDYYGPEHVRTASLRLRVGR